MNTVTEAIALNQLLQWVLADDAGLNLPIPTSIEARDAAALLTEKARKTGASLYSSEQLKEKWPYKNRALRPDECHCWSCKKTRSEVDALICTLTEPCACMCSGCIREFSATLDAMVVTKQRRKAWTELPGRARAKKPTKAKE